MRKREKKKNRENRANEHPEDIKEKKKVIKEYVENIGLNWNGDSKQHTLTISFKLPLVNDGISYQKGKTGRYLKDNKGRKKYEVLDGKKTLTTPTHSETYSTVTDFARFLG